MGALYQLRLDDKAFGGGAFRMAGGESEADSVGLVHHPDVGRVDGEYVTDLVDDVGAAVDGDGDVVASLQFVDAVERGSVGGAVAGVLRQAGADEPRAPSLPWKCSADVEAPLDEAGVHVRADRLPSEETCGDDGDEEEEPAGEREEPVPKGRGVVDVVAGRPARLGSRLR